MVRPTLSRNSSAAPTPALSAEHDHDAFARALGLKLSSPIVKRSHSRLPNVPLSMFLQSSLQPTPIGSTSTSPREKPLARPLSAPTLASAAKLAAASREAGSSMYGGGRRGGSGLIVPVSSTAVSSSAHTSWVSQVDKRPSVTIRRVVDLHKSWRSANFNGTTKIKGFLHVLRCHYPAASKAKLESMIAEARPSFEANDRKAWIKHTRATQSERLVSAFGASASSHDACPLHVDTFLSAVEEGLQAAVSVRPPLAELPRGSGSRAAAAMAQKARAGAEDAQGEDTGEVSPRLRALHALRTAIAASRSTRGETIDADELIRLCASLPPIVDAFEAIVERGLRLAQQKERDRLEMQYRHPVSPAKSGQRGGCVVKSPSSGMRFRPTLYDLRPMSEVELRMPRHATSTRW